MSPFCDENPSRSEMITNSVYLPHRNNDPSVSRLLCQWERIDSFVVSLLSQWCFLNTVGIKWGFRLFLMGIIPAWWSMKPSARLNEQWMRRADFANQPRLSNAIYWDRPFVFVLSDREVFLISRSVYWKRTVTRRSNPIRSDPIRRQFLSSYSLWSRHLLVFLIHHWEKWLSCRTVSPRLVSSVRICMSAYVLIDRLSVKPASKSFNRVTHPFSASPSPVFPFFYSTMILLIFLDFRPVDTE